MNEKRFKKGLTRRLFSVVLALTMVVALMPMNSTTAYAASYGGSTTFNGVIVTVTGDGWEWLDEIGWWRCGDHVGLYLKPSATTNNLYATDIGGDYITITNENGGTHRCSTCGATVSWGVSTHTHGSWDYTADGATLTAKCKADGECTLDDKKVSLTLSASSPNYSGSAATISIGADDTQRTAWTTAGLTLPTVISYEKADGTPLAAAPTEVGSYVAKVSPVGETATAANTAKVSFTIEQAHEADTTKYSHDDTNHWRPCVVIGCTNAEHKYSTAAHSYDSTSHECVCGKVDPDFHQHEKGTHHPAVAATCEAIGNVEYWDCTGTCGKKLDTNKAEISDVTISISETHSFASTWSKDATHHWKAATCSHTSQKADEAVHDANGIYGGCSVCGYGNTAPAPTPTPESEPTPAPVVVDETKLPVEIVKKDKTDVYNVIATDVNEDAYNLSKFTTVKGFAYGLETAVKYEQKKNETAVVKSTEVEVYTGYAYTFGKACIDVFKNSNVDVVYTFMHKGHLFKVTIPAGTDITNLLDKNGFAGPLWIGKELGTAELLK